MIVIARQKPRTWLVRVAGVVVLGAAVFVSLDEGPGAGVLVLLIGACPLVAYWYFKIRPWAEDPEVLEASLRAVAGVVARRGRISQDEAERVRLAEDRAKSRWEAEQRKK